MKTLTIRGINPELSEKVKKNASKNNLSINQFVLNILKEYTGLSKFRYFKSYNDLDKLAGTWNEDDENDFKKSIKELGEIDKELWQ